MGYYGVKFITSNVDPVIHSHRCASDEFLLDMATPMLVNKLEEATVVGPSKESNRIRAEAG